MDYKSKLHPKFVHELTKLCFVVGDYVLGNDAKAILISLLCDFNKISYVPFQNNIELSQFYTPQNEDLASKYDLCEFVLKYNDSSLAVNIGHLVEDNLECEINRGVICFYMRHHKGDTYQCQRISVYSVEELKETENLTRKYGSRYYVNDKEVEKINTTIYKASCRSNKINTKKMEDQGKLESSTPSGIKIIEELMRNLNETRTTALVDSQMKMYDQNIISTTPSSENVKKMQALVNKLGLYGFIVAGESFIPFSPSDDVIGTTGQVGGSGLTLDMMGGLSLADIQESVGSVTKSTVDDISKQFADTISNIPANVRAALKIDGTVSTVPMEKAEQVKEASQLEVSKSPVISSQDLSSKNLDNLKSKVSLPDSFDSTIKNAYNQASEYTTQKINELSKNLGVLLAAIPASILGAKAVKSQSAPTNPSTSKKSPTNPSSTKKQSTANASPVKPASQTVEYDVVLTNTESSKEAQVKLPSTKKSTIKEDDTLTLKTPTFSTMKNKYMKNGIY